MPTVNRRVWGADDVRAPDPSIVTSTEISSLNSVFILAATDTTVNSLTRIFYILAIHPEAQDRVRREVVEAQEHQGELQYDESSSLPFLDAVCRESLRLCVPPLHPFESMILPTM